MADGVIVDDVNTAAGSSPPPGEDRRTAPADTTVEPRPHRGRLIAPDPVLRHEYRGLFATRWIGRLGWFVLALLLILAVTVVAYMLGFGALWSVGAWRDESEMYTNAVGTMNIEAGNGYGFAVLALVGIGFAVPAVLVGRVFYGRWWHALTYDSPFRWYNFVKAGTAYVILLLCGAAIGAWTMPETYSVTSILTDPPPRYAMWFGIGLFAILVQSFGEELLFRGLLPRMFGALIPFRLIAVGAVMALFIGLHVGNPDVGQDLVLNLILFAAMEVLYFTILFRTRSISATWAIHWINNAFIFLLISTEPGRMSSMVPFIYTDPVWSAGESYLMRPEAYIQFGIAITALCIMLFWRWSPFYLPWHDEEQ